MNEICLADFDLPFSSPDDEYAVIAEYLAELEEQEEEYPKTKHQTLKEIPLEDLPF